MSIGTVATSIGGGSANEASTATWTRSTVAPAPWASAIAVARASADGSEKSVGTRMRLMFRRSINLKLDTAGVGTTPVLYRRLDRPGRMRQEGAMPKLTIAPRIRSFICLNAHPVGCATNVEREIAVATAGAPGAGSSMRS